MKLLISDLDGTLYPKNDTAEKSKLKENIEAVKKWIAGGNVFAVATARGLHHYPVLTEKLGFACNFIGSNGAEMVLENGQKFIKQMPCGIFLDICAFIKEKGINASVATGINNRWVWSGRECYPIAGTENKTPYWKDIVLLEDIEVDPQSGVQRIQIIIPAEIRDEVKVMIENRNYGVTVTTSDVDLIDIGPSGASKGISIQEMCDIYKIDKKDLVVVGDSENDIPMFELTSSSYCIDHAEEKVLRKAAHKVETLKAAIEIELAD